MVVQTLADIHPEVRACIREMMRRVGITGEQAKAFEFTEGWYTRHSWTTEQQNDFRAWLTKRWRGNKLAYKSLWGRRPTSQQVGREVAWFTLMWMWRVRD